MSYKETVESERYEGSFVSDSRGGHKSRGTCEYRRSVAIWWYEGTGRIKEKLTQQVVTFHFQTFSIDWFERWTLREAIIGFQNPEDLAKRDRPILLSGVYLKIVDLSLERLFRQAIASSEDLVTLFTQRIRNEKLIERGWMVDKKGEIHLPDFIPA